MNISTFLLLVIYENEAFCEKIEKQIMFTNHDSNFCVTKVYFVRLSRAFLRKVETATTQICSRVSRNLQQLQGRSRVALSYHIKFKLLPLLGLMFHFANLETKSVGRSDNRSDCRDAMQGPRGRTTRRAQPFAKDAERKSISLLKAGEAGGRRRK